LTHTWLYARHVYDFKLYKYEDDSETKSTIPETSPPSSAGAKIISSDDDDDGGDEEEKRKSIPSRRLNSYGNIQDILHDCVQDQDCQAQGILP
jgi:hypothetical protein